MGKTKDNWQWRKRGLVLFLGGDQFFALAVAKRLGYSSVIYAEWDARWYRWVDHFAVMNQAVIRQIPVKYQSKFTIVGDLMTDVSGVSRNSKQQQDNGSNLIGLLPGSKPAKLAQGVPLCLAIATKIQEAKPDTRFIIPVAPTIDLETLAKFSDLLKNPVIEKMGGVTAELINQEQPLLVTSTGVNIKLIREFPAYEILSQCSLCLTTIGANTAQLGALAIPMLVLIPTQQLDAMRAWDGIPGILANLPGIGSIFAKLINWLVLRKRHLFAWPNIWAGREIVPELVGKLQAQELATMVIDLLDHPEKLAKISADLRGVRGVSGAAEKIAELIKSYIQQVD